MIPIQLLNVIIGLLESRETQDRLYLIVSILNSFSKVCTFSALLISVSRTLNWDSLFTKMLFYSTLRFVSCIVAMNILKNDQLYVILDEVIPYLIDYGHRIDQSQLLNARNIMSL